MAFPECIHASIAQLDATRTCLLQFFAVYRTRTLAASVITTTIHKCGPLHHHAESNHNILWAWGGGACPWVLLLSQLLFEFLHYMGFMFSLTVSYVCVLLIVIYKKQKNRKTVCECLASYLFHTKYSLLLCINLRGLDASRKRRPQFLAQSFAIVCFNDAPANLSRTLRSGDPQTQEDFKEENRAEQTPRVKISDFLDSDSK